MIAVILTMIVTNANARERNFMCITPNGSVYTGVFDNITGHILSWNYWGNVTGTGTWWCWFLTKTAPVGGGGTGTDYNSLTSTQKYIITTLNSVRPGSIGGILMPTELEHMVFEAPPTIEIPIDMVHGSGASILR